jgi:ADP-ribose pyrophosphatase YjhB (NUDIX family)
VLVVREGKILLGKRAEPGFRAGHWCLPGGFLEFGEHFLAAAHREILEETGIKVEIQSILNVVSNFLSERLETLVIVLLANYSSGNIRPGDDLAELSWFSLDEALPTMAFEADEYIIHQYASGHKTGLPVDPRYRKSV